MNPIRYRAWKAMCRHKHRHKSYGAALAQVRALQELKGETVHPYLCPFCHYWHVGHDTRRRAA